MRSKETGQLAGRTRGTKRNGRNERCRQMGGGGMRRGNGTTSQTTRGLEGRDAVDGSLMVRYSATAPRQQWTARRLLDGEGRLLNGEGRCNGSSTARHGVRRFLSGKGRCEPGGDGLEAQRRCAVMDSVMANGR